MGTNKKSPLEAKHPAYEGAEVIPISSASSYKPLETNQLDTAEYDEMECARIAHQLGLTVIRSRVGLVVKVGDCFPLVADHLKKIGKLPR